MIHEIVQGRLSPAMPFAFTTGGVPYNLTGKSVKFSAQLLEATTLAIDHAACTIDNAVGGTGHYAFASGNTDVFGHYRVRWTIVEDSLDLPVSGWDDLFVREALPLT